MIFKLEHHSNLEEVEVVIKYTAMNEEIERILSLLKSADKKIKCVGKGMEKFISISDIYYIESIDKKTFIYCEKEIYRTDLRLYQLLDQLEEHDFVQISKSCILNTNVLEAIRPLANSRMEALLKNSEKLYVSRKYLAGIKAASQKGGFL
ncbi:MAG: LytTR family DNA-binding domain-containing protein [Lachnospiraceae bacterium]